MSKSVKINVDAMNTASDSPNAHERPLWRSMWRGWCRKCPNCGQGPLLHRYVKVNHACSHCQEELHHHRSDDGPAYFTILIVGHVVAPLMLWVFVEFRPEPLWMLVGFVTLAVGLCAYLLPRIKGAFVAFQWARLLHGFGGETENVPQVGKI